MHHFHVPPHLEEEFLKHLEAILAKEESSLEAKDAARAVLAAKAADVAAPIPPHLAAAAVLAAPPAEGTPLAAHHAANPPIPAPEPVAP
jgi:hypothetical protein